MKIELLTQHSGVVLVDRFSKPDGERLALSLQWTVRMENGKRVLFMDPMVEDHCLKMDLHDVWNHVAPWARIEDQGIVFELKWFSFMINGTELASIITESNRFCQNCAALRHVDTDTVCLLDKEVKDSMNVHCKYHCNHDELVKLMTGEMKNKRGKCENHFKFERCSCNRFKKEGGQ